MIEKVFLSATKSPRTLLEIALAINVPPSYLAKFVAQKFGNKEGARILATPVHRTLKNGKMLYYQAKC